MQLNLAKHGRARILAYCLFAIVGVFILRLFYLQIIQHGHYMELANAEQMKQRVLPASRGEIYAMNGEMPVKLVMNEKVYTVFADPQIITAEDHGEIIAAVEEIAGGTARPNLADLLAKKESRYQILATKVTEKQAELLKKRNLVGVGFQKDTRRVYPEGGLAAQVLGFVDAEGQGKYGVEGGLNERLSGKDGLRQSVTDVRDVPLTIGGKNIEKPAVNGDNIVLTIDRNVQAQAEKALADGLKRSGATNGSVLVMDPQTGKVLAMANMPTYKPAEFTKVQDAAAFNNSTISMPYEPGSVIKTLTMATAADKGIATADSTYVNTDYIKVGDRTISNATKGHTGTITMQTAMDYSLNTGFVTLAERLGDGEHITREARNTMYEYFHDRLGLGERTGIELAGEARGVVVAPGDTDGGAVRYSNMSFGQGMNVTMVQVCAAFSSIVNGGTYYQPTIIAGTMDANAGQITPAPQKTVRHQVISAAASAEVRKMTHDARIKFYGGADTNGYYVGGKTGTSQTLKNGIYVDDETIATYLGYGGSDGSRNGPKYVIMVQVSGKHMNLGGNTDAMPIFTDISNWMLDYMKIQPKG